MILGIDPGSIKIGLALLETSPRLRVHRARILPVKNVQQLDEWLQASSLVVLERPNLKGLLTKAGRKQARTLEGAKFLYDMAAVNLTYARIRAAVVERGLPLLEPVGYYSGPRGERTWLHELTGLKRPSRSDVRSKITREFGLAGILQEDILDAVGLALFGYVTRLQDAPISA